MGYVILGVGWRDEVGRAEEQARRMMDAAGFSVWLDASDEKWIEAFGDTEADLREQEDALARRVLSIPFWRWRERRAATRAYISVHAMLTVAHGLVTEWR